MKIFLVTIFVAILGCKQASGQLVSEDEFRNAVTNNKYDPPTSDQYREFASGIQALGGVSSKEEAAMALAQFIHESGGLKQKEEEGFHGSTGNNRYSQPGCDAPGKSYHGRGYIQLTGCANYKAASQRIFGNEETLRNNPEMVSDSEEVAWKTTFSYWRNNVHDAQGVSSGQFGSTTRAINGHYECDGGEFAWKAQVRFEKYGKVREAFHLDGPGNSAGC